MSFTTVSEHLRPPQAGDRVCVAALATDHCLEALLAVNAAGGIAAPLNWRWGAAEAAGAVQLVGARLLAADAGCLPFAVAAAAASPRGAVARLLLLGPPASFRQADLAAAQSLGLTPAFAESLIADCGGHVVALRHAPGGTALIVYTSGGLPALPGVPQRRSGCVASEFPADWGRSRCLASLHAVACPRCQVPCIPPAGTTGKPKGVALSHAALHSQSMAKLLTVSQGPALCGHRPGSLSPAASGVLPRSPLGPFPALPLRRHAQRILRRSCTCAHKRVQPCAQSAATWPHPRAPRSVVTAPLTCTCMRPRYFTSGACPLRWPCWRLVHATSSCRALTARRCWPPSRSTR